MKKLLMIIMGLLVAAVTAQAEELVVPMHLTDSAGVGKAIGTVTASSSPHGTILVPDLKDLTPGLHGFHIHQNPDCGPGVKSGKKIPGLAAGGP